MKNRRIVALSTLWMLGIVLYHCGQGVSAAWYRELLADFRVGGVSYFFVVSGFFLARHAQGGGFCGWWRGEILKRVRSLLLPYFLWCAIGLSGPDLLRQFGLVGVAPAADSPLWYVKFLFLFCLVSPLLVAGVRGLRGWALPVLGVLLALLPHFALPMKFSLVHSLLAFAVGLALGLRREGGVLAKIPSRGALAALLLWALCYGLRVFAWGGNWPLNVYSSCSLVAGLWLLAGRLEFRRELPWVFGVSFWVYCVHALLLRWLPLPGAATVPGALACGVIVFAASCLSALPVSRFLPRLYSLLTGNRS